MGVYNFNNNDSSWYNALQSFLDTDIGNSLTKSNSTNTISLKDDNWASFHWNNLLKSHLVGSNIKILDYINNSKSEIDDYIDNAGGLLYWNGDRNSLYKGDNVKDYLLRFNKLAPDYNEKMFNWRLNNDPYFNYTVQNISGDRKGGSGDSYTGSQNALRVRYLHHSSSYNDFNDWRKLWLALGAVGAKLYRGFWVPILDSSEVGSDENTLYVNFNNYLDLTLNTLAELPSPDKVKGFKHKIGLLKDTSVVGETPTDIKMTEPLKLDKLFNLVSDALSSSRLWLTLRNNRKVHDIYNNSIRPVLKDTYERYSPVTGDFGMLSLKNLQGAEVLRLASRPFTSDASLMAARLAEAQNLANKLLTEGYLIDNLRIRETAREALLRQEDNVARRTEVANYNRLLLQDVRERRAENDALTLKANWQSLDLYLLGFEKRFRYENEKKQLDIDNWNDIIILQNALKWLDLKYLPIKDRIAKLERENPGVSITSLPEYDSILRSIQLLQNMYTDYLYLLKAGLSNINYSGIYTKSLRDSWQPKFKLGGKFVPKLAGGSSIANALAVYLDISGLYYDYKLLLVLASEGSSKSKKSSSKSESDSNKGDFTKKDFINAIKDAKLLPNDVNALYTSISNMFAKANMLGSDVSDISLMYLLIMPMLNNAKLNRERYDKVEDKLRQEGKLYDLAYYLGGIYATDSLTGNITHINKETYDSDRERYNPITYGLLLWCTANMPNLSYNHSLLEVANSAISLKEVVDLIKNALYKVGTQTVEYDTFGTNLLFALAYKGAQGAYETLLNLIAGPLGYYKLTQALLGPDGEGIKKLLNFAIGTLPDAAKGRLLFQTLNGTWQEVENLVAGLITGQVDTETKLLLSPVTSVNEDGTIGKKSKLESKNEPIEGFWGHVLELRGDNYSFNILKNTGLLSTEGKIYTSVPNIDKDMSLLEFLNKSGGMNVVSDKGAISFGDIKLDAQSLKDVMVDNSSNYVTATLPKTPNGSVDFGVLDEYLEILQTLKDLGYNINSREFYDKLRELMNESHLGYLLDSSGMPRKELFGHFFIVKGLASDQTLGKNPKNNNKSESFEEIESNYTIKYKNNRELQDRLKLGLSTDLEYNLDSHSIFNPLDLILGSDSIYEGNIFIPLTTSLIKSLLADENSIKKSTALEYDLMLQIKEKESKVNNDTLL